MTVEALTYEIWKDVVLFYKEDDFHNQFKQALFDAIGKYRDGQQDISMDHLKKIVESFGNLHFINSNYS